MAWQDIFAASEWGNYFRQQGSGYSSFGHRGTDLTAGDGKTLYAWEELTVVDSDAFMDALGNCINLRAKDGKYFGVAHVRKGTRPANGTVLKPGDRIAEAARGGSRGSADYPGTSWTGPHYHIVMSDNPAAAFGQGNLEDARPRILAAVGQPAPEAGYAFGLTTAAQLAAQKALAKLGLYAGAQDGDFGPKSVAAFQQHLKNIGLLESSYVVDGVPGKIYGLAIQKLAQGFGYTGSMDGVPGPQTSAAIEKWGASIIAVVPPVTNPNPVVPKPQEPAPDPDMVTPSPEDFPAWIAYDEQIDPDSERADLLEWALDYYKNPYYPIESHTHWWGEPGKAGSHDGNVSYIKSTGSLSVNYVVSENRITLMVPLDKIALTTGQRNPFAWKSENNPTLTEQQYKTMGYLHYIVEKLNPRLAGEQIRLHKEFYSTSCAGIDVAKVRSYAEMFRTGALDVATGLAPVTPPVDPEVPTTPEPEPEEEAGMPVPEVPVQNDSTIAALLNSVLPLGARRKIYITYWVVGVILGTFGAVLMATGVLAPVWFVGVVGGYGYLGPFIALLATANTPRK